MAETFERLQQFRREIDAAIEAAGERINMRPDQRLPMALSWLMQRIEVQHGKQCAVDILMDIAEAIATETAH